MGKAQRRKFLMGMGVAAPLAMQWQKPIINAVITPAHAQTSVCTTQDVVGIWDIFFEDDNEKAGVYNLFEDGTGISLVADRPQECTVEWVLYSDSSTISIIECPGNDVIQFIGPFGNNCSEFKGVEGRGNTPVYGKKRG